MEKDLLIYGVCLLGIASRTVVPYLQAWRENPEMKFDKKFIVPGVVSLVLNLIVAPFALQGFEVTSLSYFAAYILGWGATDQVREVLKFAGASSSALSWLK